MILTVMKNRYCNFTSGLLFPIQFQVLGYVFLFAGATLFVINIWASLIFIALGCLIVSAFFGIQFKGGRFREYNAFFFVKSGKWQPYAEVEKIFIKKVKTSQKFYGRANQSSTIKSVVYKAFAKFDSGTTVLLVENKDKSKVQKKIKKVVDYLRTDVIDYSD
jgi:hypothetical protein